MGGVAVLGKSLKGRVLPRTRVVMLSRLSWPAGHLVAHTRDLSDSGVALFLPEDTDLNLMEKAHLHMANQITLQLIVVHKRREPARLVAGFQVVSIEEGAEQWKDLIDTIE
jgi:hypothetical protein